MIRFRGKFVAYRLAIRNSCDFTSRRFVTKMVVIRYGKGELVDTSACALQRADLKKCLLDSDCCQKLKKTPRECLRNPEGMVPNECFALRVAFFECKRSMLDMRARFRGLRQ